MKIDGNSPQELKDLKTGLGSNFEKMECYLLPHPGLYVATNPDFNGDLNKVETPFLEQIQKFCCSVLSPKNIYLNKIGGCEMQAKEMVKYFQSYLEIFKVIQFYFQIINEVWPF